MSDDVRPAAMRPPAIPKILLVDDRADNLAALRAVLEPLEFTLVEATSGDEALRRLLVDEFAVIILDVQMPDLDGFATAKMIRAREKTRYLPIIFLTAISGEPIHHLTGYRAGAIDYVHKPFAPEILRAKVAVLVELWSRGATIKRQSEELSAQLAQINQAHAALVDQAVELERSNVALERFAQMASEQLLDPLHALSGLLDLTMDRHGRAMPEEALQLVERSSRSVERMAASVTGLLEYAESSREHLALTEISLSEVVDDALKQLPSAGRPQVSYSNLPLVCADRTFLGRLFTGLFSVAGDVWGDPVPDLKLSATAGSEGCAVSLRSDRPGVSPAQAARLFTVFGTGRGPMGPLDTDLAICRRIVERHGGEIWAETADNGALLVRFTLPAGSRV
jgi:DNA-binding response OmpR family regulator